MSWVLPNTILYVRTGSQAYGTALPESDEDFRGITIPPPEYTLGVKRFEQFSLKTPDVTIYGLHKYILLALACNPNILELLFVNQGDIMYMDSLGQELRKHRQLFLSKKCYYTYTGYAVGQLKRLKSHRSWLLNPQEVKPTRREYGLPDKPALPKGQIDSALAQIRKHMDAWEIDFGQMDEAEKLFVKQQISQYLAELQIGKEEKWNITTQALGMSDDFVSLLRQERDYRRALTGWNSYQSWKANRNEKRAALEREHGYDTKHAMHLVRLLTTCAEILENGTLHVRRPDADFLNFIRQGGWSYEELMKWAEEQSQLLQQLYSTSSLPRLPDFKSVEELTIDIFKRSYGYTPKSVFMGGVTSQ